MTRKKRLTRVVYGAYVVLVTAFVVSSISQVASALFGAPKTAAAAEASPKVGPACAKLLEEHVEAIDRARLAASGEPDDDAARARYAKERAAPPDRDTELERVCSADPHGKGALASLARFDRAAQSHAFRTASELSPVRLGSQSFISGHPR